MLMESKVYWDILYMPSQFLEWVLPLECRNHSATETPLSKDCEVYHINPDVFHYLFELQTPTDLPWVWASNLSIRSL